MPAGRRVDRDRLWPRSRLRCRIVGRTTTTSAPHAHGDQDQGDRLAATWRRRQGGQGRALSAAPAAIRPDHRGAAGPPQPSLDKALYRCRLRLHQDRQVGDDRFLDAGGPAAAKQRRQVRGDRLRHRRRRHAHDEVADGYARSMGTGHGHDAANRRGRALTVALWLNVGIVAGQAIAGVRRALPRPVRRCGSQPGRRRRHPARADRRPLDPPGADDCSLVRLPPRHDPGRAGQRRAHRGRHRMAGRRRHPAPCRPASGTRWGGGRGRHPRGRWSTSSPCWWCESAAGTTSTCVR